MNQNISKNADVVDAIQSMCNGSPLIHIVNNKIDFGWTRHWITADHERMIYGLSGQILFEFNDIANVFPADDERLKIIDEILGNPHIPLQGLEPLVFCVQLKNGDIIDFVSNSPRRSYIWLRGLQALHSTESERYLFKSLPLLASSKLRVGNTKLYDVNQHLLLEDIMHEAHEIKQRALQLESFSKSYCILDSTEHLTILSQCMELKQSAHELTQILTNSFDQNRLQKSREKLWDLNIQWAVIELSQHKLSHELKMGQEVQNINSPARYRSIRHI